MRDAILALWTRAICRRSGMLKIKLPTVRVWVSAERDPVLTWERLRDGVWSACDPSALTDAEHGEVRAYVASNGLSADPRCVAMRIGIEGTQITWREGASP
jgi:hypothetical protein